MAPKRSVLRYGLSCSVRVHAKQILRCALFASRLMRLCPISASKLKQHYTCRFSGYDVRSTIELSDFHYTLLMLVSGIGSFATQW